MKSSKLVTFSFAIALLTLSTVSCSEAAIADEDALYEQHEGVDRYKVQVPENG